MQTVSLEIAKRLRELGLEQDLQPGDWYYSGLELIPFPRGAQPEVDWTGPFLKGHWMPFQEASKRPHLKAFTLGQVLEEIERLGWLYRLEGPYKFGLGTVGKARYVGTCWLPHLDDEHEISNGVSAIAADPTEAAALALTKIKQGVNSGSSSSQ